jgi:hypothetical protein
LIIEALMAKLKDSENRSDEFVSTQGQVPNLRLEPRVAYGIRFEYSSDFDNNGILYWIATNGGRAAWQNPHHTKRITVMASSIEKGDPTELVGIVPTELWTKDVPASWFCIDLGRNRSVVPTYYTLRHGGNYKADSLRTWDFQGSTDGVQWSLLLRHTNDQSLNGPFATCSWPIKASVGYRYFRILQTGHNSSNHNFLVISGIELYGELYEK